MEDLYAEKKGKRVDFSHVGQEISEREVVEEVERFWLSFGVREIMKSVNKN